MDAIDEINEIVGNSDKTLVFTSETAARNALMAYIRENPGKAVFSDRFISWDSFSLSLSDTKGRRQITEAERRMFVRSFLKDRGMEELTHFSSPLAKESLPSFSRYISRLLPYFPSPDDTIRKSIDPSILSDMDKIRPKYLEYLEKNNLYEERYLGKDLDKIKKGTVVFVFPEAFTSTFAQKVVESGKVEVIPVPSSFEEAPLHSYSNSISEIRGVMRMVEKDLESFSPSDIAITSSSLDTYRPYLEEEARKRDIPLSFTSRSPLSSYPEGRIMKNMYSLTREHWTLSSAKTFFMDPSYPFRERDLLLVCVRIAIDMKIVDGGYKRWMGAFDRAIKKKYPRAEEAKKLFSEIYSDVELIVKAKKANDTSLRFRSFRDKYFEENSWNEKEDRILGSMLDVLSLMGGEEDSDTFRIFLSILDDTSYVERNDNEGKVMVYSYPASAGLRIKRHYVIGLHDKATTLSVDDCPYSRDDNKPQPKDLTESLLSLYANPLFADFLYISGTEENFSGSVLLPTFFLDNSIKAKEGEEDSYSEERKGEKSIKCSRSQALSYTNAKNTIMKERNDVTVVEGLSSSPLLASVSDVKNWDDCPYKGYASSILSLSDTKYEVQMEDAREKGNILHGTIENSLEEVNVLGDMTPDILLKNLKKQLEKSYNSGAIPDEASRLHMEKSISRNLRLFPSSKGIDNFSSASLYGNEITMENLVLGENFRLKGRLDTLLRDDGGKWYILDYKINADNDWSNNSIDDTSLQVILYYRLLSSPGTTWTRSEDKPAHFTVESGGFYSLSQKKFCMVWPRTIGEDSFGLEEIEKNANNRINQIISSFSSGNVTPDPGEKQCKNCIYKRLCRGRYVAR